MKTMKVLVETHLSESGVRAGDDRSGSESKLNDLGGVGGGLVGGLGGGGGGGGDWGGGGITVIK